MKSFKEIWPIASLVLNVILIVILLSSGSLFVPSANVGGQAISKPNLEKSLENSELTDYEKRFPKTKKLIVQALTVKPGITGLWQVSGRSDTNFEERIDLDAQYAKRKNLIDDIVILIKSPWVVLTGKGAS